MKKNLYIFSVIILFTVSILTPVLSQSNKFGGGFILGDPSGLNGKAILGNHAIDIGIGPSFNDGFYLYGDYLRRFHGVFPVIALSLYIGIGPGFHHHDKGNNDRNHDHDGDYNSLECRVPFGIDYLFPQIPIELFAEIAPALVIIPDIGFKIRGGVGVRYYFQ